MLSDMLVAIMKNRSRMSWGVEDNDQEGKRRMTWKLEGECPGGLKESDLEGRRRMT